VHVKTTGLLPRPPGIPLNELDKMFYWVEPLGSRPIVRTVFEFKGGHIDLQLLRQAYALEIKRRPVLNATLAENPSGSGWDVRWMPRDFADENLAVRLCDFSGLSAEAAEKKIREIQFDPFTNYSAGKDLPFSMVLCPVPDGRQKLLAFSNHALTDAYGVGLIFQELFTTYNQLAAGLAPDDSLCPDPGLPSVALLPSSRVKRCIQVLGALAFIAGQAIKTGFQAPAKIFSGENSLSGATGAVQREMSQDRLSRYLAAAKRHGISFTVLFVAAQFQTIDRWKKARGETAGLISIDVHQNLRMEEREFLELSNKFSTFVISTLPRHRIRPKDLLQHVRREQEKAQRRGIAQKLICLLWLLDSRIVVKKLPPWVMNLLFSNPKMGDSTQVTNLGRLWAGPDNSTRITRLGDAEISGCFMASQPSPAVGNFTSFLTFKNRLFLSFNYFNRTMTDAQAQQFMDLFEKALADLAECD
jgi:NRPS condensation-like uncharacterized protein